ncbi:MAG: FAD-dependent monooxygenase [Thermoplasmatales archaeon]|nr:MAG: FAD-dependent monooxygenase [Thermoplasmatales archaeon]
MKTLSCDVLIVGAGAAGSVAALTTLKHGLNTVIIEKEKHIGKGIHTKLDLTESIGIQQIIKELNLPIYETSNRSRWFSPNYILNFESEVYDLYVKRGGDKDSFENKNIKTVLDKGGKLLKNTHLKKFEWGKNSIVKKVIVKNDAGKIKIKPSLIIGADGVNSTVLQLSGLSEYDHIFGEFHAFGVYGKDFNLPSRAPHIFFDKKIAPGGYVFTAKTKTDDCVLGVGCDKSTTNKSPEKYFEKVKSHHIISKILNNAEINNTFSGLGKYGILQRHSIGNVMLVGDAGRFGDPLFCYGVRQSILSGYNAAIVCIKNLDSNLDFELSTQYESSMRELQKEIKIGLFLREAYKKLNNKDIDVIVKIIHDAQKDGLDLDYIFKKNNNLLFKHILKNMGRCSSITLRILPNLAEYLLKIRNM